MCFNSLYILNPVRYCYYFMHYSVLEFSAQHIYSCISNHLGQFFSYLNNTLLIFSLAEICWWQSFKLCLSENVFISPSYLKNIFVGQRTSSWQFFSFYAFKVSFHCFLASTVLLRSHLLRQLWLIGKSFVFFSLQLLLLSLCFYFNQFYNNMARYAFIFIIFLGVYRIS